MSRLFFNFFQVFSAAFSALSCLLLENSVVILPPTSSLVNSFFTFFLPFFPLLYTVPGVFVWLSFSYTTSCGVFSFSLLRSKCSLPRKFVFPFVEVILIFKTDYFILAFLTVLEYELYIFPPTFLLATTLKYRLLPDFNFFTVNVFPVVTPTFLKPLFLLLL